MFQVKERPDLFAVVGFIDKHRAPLHQIPIAFEDQVDGGVQQRVAWTNERGNGRFVDLILFEADALITLKQRLSKPDLAVAGLAAVRVRG